jgi:hypothetical protein
MPLPDRQHIHDEATDVMTGLEPCTFRVLAKELQLRFAEWPGEAKPDDVEVMIRSKLRPRLDQDFQTFVARA